MKNTSNIDTTSSMTIDKPKKLLTSKFKNRIIVTLLVGTLTFFAYSYWSSIIAGFNATLAFTSSVAIPALSTFFMSAVGLYTGIGIALLLVGISSYFIYKLNSQKDTTPTIDSTYSSNEWAIVPYNPKHNNANHVADEIVVVNTINIQSIRETLLQFATKVERHPISEKPEDRVVIWKKPHAQGPHIKSHTDINPKSITKSVPFIDPRSITQLVAFIFAANVLATVFDKLSRVEQIPATARTPVKAYDFGKAAKTTTPTQDNGNGTEYKSIKYRA